MRRQVHFQADRIEMVLASHKVPARVTGGTVTPRLVRFHLATHLGVKVRQVAGLAEEIAMSLGALSYRVYREQGQVEAEVPREQGQVVHLMALARQLAPEGLQVRDGVPAATAVLGLDQEGVPLLLRLPSPNVAHVLVAGTTGSGKTALLRTIVASLALHNPQRALHLVLVDPNGRGLSPFEGLPHLLGAVVTCAEEGEGVLGRLADEMERKDGRMELDLWFREDVAHILASTWETMGAAAEGTRPDGLTTSDQRLAGAYRRGFEDALRAVGVAFGLPSWRKRSAAAAPV